MRVGFVRLDERIKNLILIEYNFWRLKTEVMFLVRDEFQPTVIKSVFKTVLISAASCVTLTVLK